MNVEEMKEAMWEAQRVDDYPAWRAIKFSDDLLTADVEAGGYGISTHPRQAAQLLRLPNVEMRVKADREANTRSNLRGGRLSDSLADAVSDLLVMIQKGEEDGEMWAGGVARRHREEEARLREMTGRQVITYPSEMRRA